MVMWKNKLSKIIIAMDGYYGNAAVFFNSSVDYLKKCKTFHSQLAFSYDKKRNLLIFNYISN